MKQNEILVILVCCLPFLAECQDRALDAKLRASNCGRRRVIPGDVRTETPWNAVIFFRSNPSSPPRYLTTGVIIGPTTILTVAPGPLGGPLRGRGETEKFHQASSFIVGVGLPTTDIRSKDNFTQLVGVHYLEPYLHHASENEVYYILLYHLKTFLDLRTPYVRAACIVPFSTYEYIFPALDEMELAQGNVAGYSTNQANLGSFKYTLKWEKSLIRKKSDCKRLFQFYYKRDIFSSVNLHCCQKLPDGWYQPEPSAGRGTNATSANVTEVSLPPIGFKSEVGEALKRKRRNATEDCFVHGSVGMFTYSNRYFVHSITVLIPSRKKRWCNDETVYFNVEITKFYGWLSKAVECSPNRYFCGDDDGICIPISNVCNGIPECPNRQDENPSMCQAQNHCDADIITDQNRVKKNVPKHFCGVTDICISSEKLCDKVNDCEEGGDEMDERCLNPESKEADGIIVRANSNAGAAEVAKECQVPPVPVGAVTRCFNSENIKVDCSSSLPVDYSVEFGCQFLYNPYYSYPSVKLTCQDTGEFTKRKPFSCVQECGRYGSVKNQTEESAFSSFQSLFRNMPWSGIIFAPKDDSDGSSALPICSVVLIDQNFFLTSASCVNANDSDSKLTVIGTTSTNFADGFLFSIVLFDKYWISQLGNNYTELALVKIKWPRNTPTNNSVPCFLANPRVYSKMPAINTTGWMTRYASATPLSTSPGSLETVPNAQPLYGYRAVVVPSSSCRVTNVATTLPSYAFCVMIEMDKLDQSGTEIGIGFYTRARSKVSSRIQYSLRGISISPLGVSLILTNSERKLRFFQWFAAIEAYSDWIIDTLERNY